MTILIVLTTCENFVFITKLQIKNANKNVTLHHNFKADNVLDSIRKLDPFTRNFIK